MKRTPMVRKTPMPRTSKPATGKPKPKKCKLRTCRKPYTPDPKQPFKVWCSDDCGAAIALERLAKQKVAQGKRERAEHIKKKQAAKTPAQLAEPVRKLAQKYSVLRDRDYGCISCDKGPHWHGVWHGSHFKSVGSNSALQFNLCNINKACDQCNFFLAGNIGPYETRLRQKIGDDRVDWLKNHPRSREYTPEYLTRLASILRKKIKRLERKA